ncbi:MAG: DNA alkylation repair protein [Pseudomonadota bacterium]
MKAIRSIIRNAATITPEKAAMFFKTGPGDYAEHDQFIGVPVPILRKIAKDFAYLSLEELEGLIKSKINEERLLALIILTEQYKRAKERDKEMLYLFYMDHLSYVNNWNLVDSSAHLLLGAHLLNKNRDILLSLAKSEIIWERRVAIVATWMFIRCNDLEWTFKIAKILLNDKHDLIHKASGWMLRELGKRDEVGLMQFLDLYAADMPRTMLRYAIEKLPPDTRKLYLRRDALK